MLRQIGTVMSATEGESAEEDVAHGSRKRKGHPRLLSLLGLSHEADHRREAFGYHARTTCWPSTSEGPQIPLNDLYRGLNSINAYYNVAMESLANPKPKMDPASDPPV
ncbi:hypothetical protein Lesp02_25530 [Lentzea sp. NBRC 105346]|nr:hypothetical protein Lesp02_25530 [Lentzea sp. NBRC 105346]